MVIQNLPPNLEQKTGIYCLSTKSPNTHHKKVVKIGRAEHFKHRLDSYHTYLSDGFYMYCFLVCRDIPQTEKVEKYIYIDHEILP
jgi:hypothetical protein